MPDLNIAEFVLHLERAVFNLAHEEHEAMERACKVVEKEAKAEIGTYQSAAGPFPAWAPLSDATLDGFYHQGGFWVQGKEDAGYAPPDNPLLREGTMRDSIQHKVEGHFAGSQGVVGTNDPVAVYQELGTPNATYPIPPRSFLGRAAYVKAHEVAHHLGIAPVLALCGHSVASKLIPNP